MVRRFPGQETDGREAETAGETEGEIESGTMSESPRAATRVRFGSAGSVAAGYVTFALGEGHASRRIDRAECRK